MREKVLELDRLTKYADEVKDLQRVNSELRARNQDLEQRLEDLHGEYLILRYYIKNTISQEEVLGLRKKILELQNELRLKSHAFG